MACYDLGLEALSMTSLERHEPQRISINGKRHYCCVGFPNVPDGTLLPSVTTVLSAMAPVAKIMALINWRKKIGESEARRRTRLASDRGTWLHGVMEDWFNGEDIEHHLERAPEWKPYFYLMEPFLLGDKDHLESICDPDSLEYVKYCDGIEKPLMTESAVAWYDPELQIGVAGTVDQFAFTKGGRFSLPDWKSSFKVKPQSQLADYKRQLGGYALAIEQMEQCSVDEAWSVLACYDPEDDNSVPTLQLVRLDGFELVAQQRIMQDTVQRYFAEHYPGGKAFTMTADKG
jgi:hypothetical protein